jgi:hypothetical protein
MTEPASFVKPARLPSACAPPTAPAATREQRDETEERQDQALSSRRAMAAATAGE